jgi:hypothetical protein
LHKWIRREGSRAATGGAFAQPAWRTICGGGAFITNVARTTDLKATVAPSWTCRFVAPERSALPNTRVGSAVGLIRATLLRTEAAGSKSPHRRCSQDRRPGRPRTCAASDRDRPEADAPAVRKRRAELGARERPPGERRRRIPKSVIKAYMQRADPEQRGRSLAPRSSADGRRPGGRGICGAALPTKRSAIGLSVTSARPPSDWTISTSRRSPGLIAYGKWGAGTA